MARRSLLGFLFLNIVVTILVTSAVILFSDARRPNEPTPARGLLQVVVTATTDPNETPPVVYVVVTATPPGTRAAASILPTATSAVTTTGAGLDTTLLPPAVGTIEAPTFTATDPSGCPTHALVEGEFLGAIATRYGVTVAQIREANELTPEDDTRLQIGDVLIIPVEGCGLSTRTPTPTASPTLHISDTPPPSSTPVAAVEGAQLEVVDVVSAGDITEEQIVIRNNSDGLVEIGGWTLEDANGNTYTFPDYQMFGGRSVLLYSRVGVNTPRALYWGLEQAIWDSPRQTITIRDRERETVLSIPISAVGGNVPTPTAAR